ncbi:transcriptional regulator NrdR [Enterococcus hirae]|jgi:transcriptional repressor NrdR|nr:transcriptional regulator NrdR [Enterococcaceae bacterium]MDM8212725.1 transcriptional regulator NrdR [Enterococcus hirae]
MRCPRCQHNNSRVIDSRSVNDGRAIRRRRECEECGFRFTTFEKIEVLPLLVIKKNGTREEFNRDKILRGLVRSAEKRPVPIKKMEEIANKVENKIRASGESEVSTKLIGEYVMDYLAEVDEIAYIRFASVYRQFKDMSTFMAELQEIMEKNDQADRQDEKDELKKNRSADE